MPDPRSRDIGLRRIRTVTGWITAAAVSAVVVISVGVARANHRSTDASQADPGASQVDPADPWGTSGGTGLQPPATPPTQGTGGGQAVSGGS
jgi:hypothetical protein